MEIINAIIDAITQTNDWNRMQEAPAIQEAEQELDAVLAGLPEDVAEEVKTAACVYSLHCERAALLYGIGVADTIRKAGADPAAYLVPTEE